MYNDLANQISDARMITQGWASNKEQITAKLADLQSFVTIGKFSYEFIFAARNSIRNLEKYLRVPSRYFEPFTGQFDECDAICNELSEIEKSATKVWLQLAPKIQSELPPAEWQKYLSHLDSTCGSTKYARDLGWI